MSAIEEAAFWNTINSEHAGFASHLLDPKERKLVDVTEDTSREILALNETASVVMTLEAGIKLDGFNKATYEKLVR